ncbi:flavin-containing monooxygenase [Mycolicibacterium sp. Dal123E01]|uniref:flavin-containing monooxygenase n=1 Tax=Mycolicibacterium sp. Dal123E01 TaxID=3457578 RepID=UPI00403EC89D
MTARVAVIGAGPAGLVASRWLLSQGFEPSIFEQGPTLGGQWTAQSGRSGVWPGMHTNSSRILTAFSDLPIEDGAVFPSGRDVLDYLHRYARMFDLDTRLRCNTRVDSVSRSGQGWIVGHGGQHETFDKVVVASGRFHAPTVPDVTGLASFSGSAGVITSYDYRGASSYHRKRVLVAGCAVSALEIATELARGGADRVVVTQRRQRYVLPKFVAGVPSDHRMFTRYGTLADETLEPAEVDRQLKEIVVESAGSPEQYGAPRPADSLFAAGVTVNQTYLTAVAEGAIGIRPWLRSVAGAAVTFDDGQVEKFDGIVFGTGFALSLPFLDGDVRAPLNLDAGGFDTDRYTFHPDLPGLAFMGMWDQSGGYFVPLELQARWIAYAWGGAVAMVGDGDQRAAVAVSRTTGQRKTRMNLAAVTFARAAGVEPRLADWPELERALLFGPLAPSCFRLHGPDALPDAPARFAAEAAAFGAITGNEMTERERSYWSNVGGT